MKMMRIVTLVKRCTLILLVSKRNDDGTFLARYDQGHKPMKKIVTATIKDILDENFIRFYPPVTNQA